MQTLTKAPKVRSYLPSGQMGRRLTEIAKLQFEIQRLENILNVHRAKVLDHMILNKLDKIEFQDITIALRQRHKYDYSVLVNNQMIELKNNQRIEIESGIAKDNPTFFINISSKAKIARSVSI